MSGAGVLPSSTGASKGGGAEVRVACVSVYERRAGTSGTAIEAGKAVISSVPLPGVRRICRRRVGIHTL